MTDTAESLIAEIRYQYPLNRQTTWGYCCNDGCDKPARGGGRCADCLTEKLAGMVGSIAHDFLWDTEGAHHQAWNILRLAKGGE